MLELTSEVLAIRMLLAKICDNRLPDGERLEDLMNRDLYCTPILSGGHIGMWVLTVEGTPIRGSIIIEPIYDNGFHAIPAYDRQDGYLTADEILVAKRFHNKYLTGQNQILVFRPASDEPRVLSTTCHLTPSEDCRIWPSQ